MKRHWFKAKRYGWGWYPATWQGWFVTMIVVGMRVDQQSHSASDTLIGTVVPICGIALCLVFIAYLTGEKPRWRWGGD